MLTSLFRRPNVRLLLALFSFLTSAFILAYMFRDDFPTLTLTEQEKTARAKARAKAEALGLWQAYNGTIHLASAEVSPPPAEPPFGEVVIAGQETTDLTWTESLEQE